MTESARVRELQHEIDELKAAYQVASKDRDAQAALVERMRERLVTIRWGIPMSDYHRNPIDALLELPPSSALQEFKERCWKEAIHATQYTAVKNLNAECPACESDADVLGWASNALRTDSIVAELKKEGR